MNRIIKIVFSIPKTLWFNFRYLRCSQAIHLPIWIAPNVRIKNMWRGGILLNKVSLGVIRIGYHEADGLDIYSLKTVLDIHKGSYLEFKADAHIGHGAIFCIKGNGKMTVGENFAVSGNTRFICANRIEIGDNVQFSWDSVVMDSDAHKIFYIEENKKPTKGIKIGNKVWIAAKTTILKGTYIGNNCVLGIGSLTNNDYLCDNMIIAGSPAKPLKEIKGWEI